MVRASFQRLTDRATAAAIAAGESAAKFHVYPMSSTAFVAVVIVQPILAAVATTAVTGPATNDQTDPFALASLLFANSSAA